MDVKQSIHSTHAKALDTRGLRNEFLVGEVFVADEYAMVYSHIDRTIVGGTIPVAKTVFVSDGVGKQLGITYFLERRELGVISIGGPGAITVNGQYYEIDHRDALYIGKETKEVAFASISTTRPTKFYYNCAPAHSTYPTKKVIPADIAPVILDDNLTSNRRTVNKYFVPGALETCQLSISLTELAPGNPQNTIPCHTRERHMEARFCLNMEKGTCVFHMMDRPQETRHTVMHSGQAMISPNWSIYSGTGTRTYTFIWGMVGEDQVFDDMDHVAIEGLCQLRATTVPTTVSIIESQGFTMILNASSPGDKVVVVAGYDIGLGQGTALGLAEVSCDIVGIDIVEPTGTYLSCTSPSPRDS